MLFDLCADLKPILVVGREAVVLARRPVCIPDMQCIPWLQGPTNLLIVENGRVRVFQGVILPALYTSYPTSEIIDVFLRSPSGTRKHH
jgi:hypothetical protein